MKKIGQSQLEEEQAGIEARVFESVQKCEDKMEDGKLTTATITEKFNEGLTEKEQTTSRFIGHKLRALGFERCRVGKKGQGGIHWDRTLIERLRTRYRLHLSDPASATSETSVTSANNFKTSIPPPSQAEETEETEAKQQTSPTPNLKIKTSLNNFKAVYWNEGFYGWHNCAVCSDTKLTSWQAETFKDEKMWLCEDCKTAWEEQREETSQ